MHIDIPTCICIQKQRIVDQEIHQISFENKGRISDSPHNVNIENDRCMRHVHFLHVSFKTNFGVKSLKWRKSHLKYHILCTHINTRFH